MYLLVTWIVSSDYVTPLKCYEIDYKLQNNGISEKKFQLWPTSQLEHLT